MNSFDLYSLGVNSGIFFVSVIFMVFWWYIDDDDDDYCA